MLINTTPYSYAASGNIYCIAFEFETSATMLFRWLINNYLKLICENPIFYLVPGNLRLFQLMEFLLLYFAPKNYYELLGVTTDSELKSKNYVTELSQSQQNTRYQILRQWKNAEH